MTDQRIIEERLENIAQMLDSTTGFLGNVDIFIPKPAKKMIYSMLKSEEINSIVEDIQRRRPPRMVLIGRSGVGKSSLRSEERRVGKESRDRRGQREEER